MIELINDDCMNIMARYPDKFFDLAIVDPPYGIGADKANNSNKGNFGYNFYHETEWDKAIPDKSYFDELFRVSKNQIICGGNYFVEYLHSSMGWIIWDKKQDNFSFSDGELLWSSFNCKLRFFRWSRSATTLRDNGRIHPTQKPVALYRYLLDNYTKPGDLILDTHAGSFSSAVACKEKGFSGVFIELDQDYFRDGKNRVDKTSRQYDLIEQGKIIPEQSTFL